MDSNKGITLVSKILVVWDRKPEETSTSITRNSTRKPTIQHDTLNSIENSIYRTAFKLRSVQALCQLDMVGSPLIQEVLLRPRFWEASAGSLSVPQLFQALQELFQRARAETPGQVHPRASKLTLSLLMAMYDSSEKGFLKLLPVAAALTALSGDSPLTKYRALFQLYAENNKGGYDSGARITRRVLRNLLTDLQQIPTVVGESRTLSSVESAVRSCFQGVLSPGIKEERFLSWVQSEPAILLWLPTCYRLSATETVTHPVRCSVCRTFPIMGLRYRCLKCLNFDICQACFLSGLHCESHQKSHPVIEHCVQMSAKENTKLLLRTLGDNLLQRCYQTKRDLRRPRLPNQVKPEDPAHRVRAELSTRHGSSKIAPPGRPARPAEAAATEASSRARQTSSQVQPVSRGGPQHQTMVSIRNELWRTQESIHVLQRERRLLKKQLNRYKDKLRAIHTFQEEKSCRFETKIQELTSKQESLQSEVQQMQQDIQAMLQSPHPSSSCQHTVPKVELSSADRFWKGGDCSQIKKVTEDGPGWKPLPDPALADRSRANAECAALHSESLVTTVQTIAAQSYAQKTPKKILSPLGQDKHQASPAEMSSAALASAGRKESVNVTEREDELEKELQELLSKLMDAFSVEMPSGPQSSVSTDLYGGAERVCRAFSALVDQITLPNLK